MPRSDIDWVLAGMVKAAANDQEHLELTVLCGGLLVSGTLAAEEVFFEKVGLAGTAESIARWRERDSEEIAELTARMDRSETSMEELEELKLKINDLQRQFITLVDVTILGAGMTPITAPAWRGRLSHISGWVLGTIDEPE